MSQRAAADHDALRAEGSDAATRPGPLRFDLARRPSLEGRVAVITGADGGLGRRVCGFFRSCGASVLPVDLTGDECLHADVTSAAGNRTMIEAAVDRYGRLDVLVLNAGTQHVAAIEDFPEPEWDGVTDVIAKGAFLGIKYAWRHLRESGSGRIIATASTSGLVGEPYKAAYVAAKHALIGLIKVAALEGIRHGITANAVAPAWIDTPMVRGQLADQARLRGTTLDGAMACMLSRQPVTRFVDPDEVASLMAFLASNASSAITGTCIPVDLGTLAS